MLSGSRVYTLSSWETRVREHSFAEHIEEHVILVSQRPRLDELRAIADTSNKRQHILAIPAGISAIEEIL